MPGGVVVNTMDVSSRVTAIDAANRKVTLLGPDGDKFTVKVGPEAINFDQIRVGDLVNTTVTEELVVYLDEKGASVPDAAAGVAALAPKAPAWGGKSRPVAARHGPRDRQSGSPRHERSAGGR